MGRSNIGTPVWRNGYIIAIRIQNSEGKRDYIKVPKTQSVAEARAFAGKHLSVSGESVAEYSERFIGHLASLKYKTIPNIKNRLRRINEIIGQLDIARVTSDDIEDVRDRLDELMLEGTLSWKTVSHHWSDLKNLFKAASLSKKRELRVRADNPTTGIIPPERGDRRAKAILYPDEVIQLLGAATLPVKARVLYALLTYSGLRSGELAALEWGDVDIPHGFFSITKALNRYTWEVESTKTNQYRRVPIEPNIIPVLTWLKKNPVVAGKNVAWYPTDGRRARVFREHLGEAGVLRHELYASTPTTQPITVHDLRGTHLTWRAIRGDSQFVIMETAGHSDFSSTLGYIKRAALLSGYKDKVFPEIPVSFYELRETDKRKRTFGQLVANVVAEVAESGEPQVRYLDDIIADSSGAEGDRTPGKQPDKTRK